MRKRDNQQSDLFGQSEPDAMRQRVKELDELIKKSIKNKDFTTAKAMADEQAGLIRQLVEKESDALDRQE